jgi:hypothetical protein
MDQEDFKKQIEELFRLFNKLIEKHPMEDIPGINRFQFEQMKMFLKNYESMKDQISFEMMGQMNEPMKQMIGLFIKQLKRELGEPEHFEEAPLAIAEEVNDIAKIDEMLSKPGLSEVEIDRLLDERASLLAKGKQE